MYSDEYIESLKQEAESMRPRIEELRQIIFCPDSKATVSDLKEFCALNERIGEITDIFSAHSENLSLREAELREKISLKDAEIRIQESLIDAMEKYLKK